MLDENRAQADIDTLWGSPHHCPRCVWPYLHAESTADDTHWVCDSCGRHWYFEHGELHAGIGDR